MFVIMQRTMSYRLIPVFLVTLCLTACGSTSTSPSTTTPAPAGSTTVMMVSGASTLSSTAYSPNPISVSVGTIVSWLNNDNTAHTSAANNGAWTSPSIAPGSRFNQTFTTAGSFPYHCTIHPGMVGTITVQ